MEGKVFIIDRRRIQPEASGRRIQNRERKWWTERGQRTGRGWGWKRRRGHERGKAEEDTAEPGARVA